MIGNLTPQLNGRDRIESITERIDVDRGEFDSVSDSIDPSEKIDDAFESVSEAREEASEAFRGSIDSLQGLMGGIGSLSPEGNGFGVRDEIAETADFDGISEARDNFEMPEFEMPEFHAPDIDLPDFHAPDIDIDTSGFAAPFEAMGGIVEGLVNRPAPTPLEGFQEVLSEAAEAPQRMARRMTLMMGLMFAGLAALIWYAVQNS